MLDGLVERQVGCVGTCTWRWGTGVWNRSQRHYRITSFVLTTTNRSPFQARSHVNFSRYFLTRFCIGKNWANEKHVFFFLLPKKSIDAHEKHNLKSSDVRTTPFQFFSWQTEELFWSRQSKTGVIFYFKWIKCPVYFCLWIQGLSL